jgi:hypothetical protein
MKRFVKNRKSLSVALSILLGFLLFWVNVGKCDTALSCNTNKKPTWTDKVADITFMWMAKRHYLHKGWDWMYIRDRILDCEWACHYMEPGSNKSWGPNTLNGRRLITLKLLSAYFRQSGLDIDCYNFNPKWKTFDRGLAQINDCHTFCAGPDSDWFVFCKLEHIDAKNPRNVFSPEYNAKFGAFVNERRIQEGFSPYDYYNPAGDEKNSFYTTLLKTTGLEALALQYNDGQYTPKPVNKTNISKKENIISSSSVTLMNRSAAVTAEQNMVSVEHVVSPEMMSAMELPK